MAAVLKNIKYHEWIVFLCCVFVRCTNFHENIFKNNTDINFFTKWQLGAKWSRNQKNLFLSFFFKLSIKYKNAQPDEPFCNTLYMEGLRVSVISPSSNGEWPWSYSQSHQAQHQFIHLFPLKPSLKTFMGISTSTDIWLKYKGCRGE